MNAFKHGMRAKKLELLRGDSFAFENRLHEWLAIAEPKDDMAEFLVHQNVFMSFEVERARRAHLEGLTSQIEKSDDTEIEKVWELGQRLFFDPTAPIELYGAPGVFRSKVRTSWNGRADDPNDPAALVRKLESSEPGCWFLHGYWEDLRAKLEPRKFWQSHDRLTAIRLLGSQPLSAITDRRVAEIFVASHALYPVGESPFDYLLSDMTEMDLDRYRKAVKAAWPDLVSANDTAQCRQILIDLVDCHLEHLNEIIAEHQASADSIAQKTVDRLGAAKSPEGQRLAAYHVQCQRALDRGIETLRKYQGKKKAEGRDRKDEYAGMMAKDGERRIADFARWAPPVDTSDHIPDRAFVAGHGERDSGTGTAGATHSASDTMIADATLWDGATVSDDTSASASVTLSAGITLLEASERDAGAGDAIGNSRGVSEADALANRGDAMSPSRGENSENVTNEANFDETVIIIQNKDPVAVMATSGVDAGLDKREERPGRAGRKEEGNNQKSQFSNAKSRDIGLEDRVAGVILRTRLSKRERRRRRREVETRELVRWLEASPRVSVSDMECRFGERFGGEKSVTDVIHIPTNA